MPQRGRKSAASLTVVPKTTKNGPAAPPDGLSEAEKGVWEAVIAAKPLDWFTSENLPLLSDYCRHIVRQDKLSQMINTFREADHDSPVKALDDLLRMSERESRIICALATKMRLTQQSRFNDQKAATMDRRGKAGAAPWAWDK